MTKYLLLTKEQKLLAKGIMEGGNPESNMQLKILEGNPKEVADREIVYLIGDKTDEAPMECKVVKQRGARILLQKLSSLNPELRRSYRIPTDFDSFLYPLNGKWQGRKSLKAADISCGGVSFYSTEGMEKDEIVEMVLPNVQFPVLVHVQILRKEALTNGRTHYACKFVDLCRGEEEAVFRYVFGIQIAKRKRDAARSYSM